MKKRGIVTENSVAIATLTRSKSKTTLITDTRRGGMGRNGRRSRASSDADEPCPELKPQLSFWDMASRKIGFGKERQPPPVQVQVSGGVSTRGLGDIDAVEESTARNNRGWISALSGKFDPVATGIVNFAFPHRPKTPVEVEAKKYAYLHEGEEHPET